MKFGSIICTILFVLGFALAILQLWLGLFEAEFFSKMLITIGALFIVALGVTLVVHEYFSDKEMKKKGFID